MKTLIIGTGVIGTLYGWVLSEKGVDITHLVRPGRKEEYKDGINLDVYDIREGYPESTITKYYPKMVEDISEKVDYNLILIPCRQYQLVDIITFLKEKKAPGTYLCFTNNWDGLDEIDKLIPRSKYLWGYAASVGGFIDDTMYFSVCKDYRIGFIEGNNRSEYDSVVELFKKADFYPEEKDDIIEWLWLHHAQVAGMIGSIFYFGSTQKVFEKRDNAIMMINAVDECLEVVRKRGVNVDEAPEVAPYVDADIDETIAKLKYFLLDTKWGQRSTQLSHLNTNPEDMKLIFRDVYLTAKKLGLSTPNIDKLNNSIL